MKKAPKIEYGIQIVKPWSKEMYDHNEVVADTVRTLVTQRWENALNVFKESFEPEEDFEVEVLDLDWYQATDEMVTIQKAVTYYSFAGDFTVDRVSQEVETDLRDAPFYRLKEIAEDLELDLKVGFIGFN